MVAADAPPAPPPAEIVVTALARPAGEVAYNTVTLPPRTLRGTAAGRLEDILGAIAGFQQFRRTDSRAANPTSQGATLRALGGNAATRALVLLDGAPVADPFAGYIPWFALAPDRLASVRVTRGAGAGAFGEGALAGTIELASADPGAATDMSAEVDGGSYGSLSARGSVAVPLAGGGITVAAREDRGDGYLLIPANQRGPADIPAAYDQHSASLRAVVPTGGATFSLNALAYDDRRTRGVAGVTSHDTGFLGSVRLTGGSTWRYDALVYLDAPTFATTAVSLDPTRTVATPSSDQFKHPGDRRRQQGRGQPAAPRAGRAAIRGRRQERLGAQRGVRALRRQRLHPAAHDRRDQHRRRRLRRGERCGDRRAGPDRDRPRRPLDDRRRLPRHTRARSRRTRGEHPLPPTAIASSRPAAPA